MMRSPVPDDAPLIGVTGPDGWYHLAWRCSRYALHRAGARVVRLTPSRVGPLPSLDGVVIGGGDDIDPELYAGLDDGTTRPDRERDALEVAVIEHALARDLPVLGICRGAQLVNVVLGGNLHQDIRSMRRRTSNRRTILPRKTVHVEPPSRLRKIMGPERTRVNSLHYQAVDRLGEGMEVVARDLDGIVQGIERAASTLCIGVQWHPEYLPYRREQRNLFNALVSAAVVR